MILARVELVWDEENCESDLICIEKWTKKGILVSDRNSLNIELIPWEIIRKIRTIGGNAVEMIINK